MTIPTQDARNTLKDRILAEISKGANTEAQRIIANKYIKIVQKEGIEQIKQGNISEKDFHIQMKPFKDMLTRHIVNLQNSNQANAASEPNEANERSVGLWQNYLQSRDENNPHCHSCNIM